MLKKLEKKLMDKRVIFIIDVILGIITSII